VIANSYNSSFLHPKCKHSDMMQTDTNVPASTRKCSHILVRLLENLVHFDDVLLIHLINMQHLHHIPFPLNNRAQTEVSFGVWRHANRADESSSAWHLSHFLCTCKQWSDSSRGATTGGNHGTLSECYGCCWSPASIFTCLESYSKPAILTCEQ